MTIRTLLLPAAFLGCVTTPLPAQEQEPQGHRPPPPLIAALDKDEDGVISKREISLAPRALKTLDANKDGELTPEELRPPRPEGAEDRPPRNGEADGPPKNGDNPAGQRPPLPPIVQALDKDEDGKISAREIRNASEALSSLDQNQDGSLTRDELRPPRPGELSPDGPPPGGPRGPGGRPPGPPHGGPPAR